jgi:hypothetical protein
MNRTRHVLAASLAFALLGLFPLLVKKALAWFRARAETRRGA